MVDVDMLFVVYELEFVVLGVFVFDDFDVYFVCIFVFE